MAAIEIDSLGKEFDTPSGVIQAVQDVDLAVDQGEFISILGPSGCGKTTALRCIAGLERPSNGKIWIQGEDMTYTPANKRNLAMMFQNIALYPHMTLEENIAYPLKVAGIPQEKRAERAREAAEILQISDLLKKYPGDLSGGQQQRGALARTIVQDPHGFLMDEPLSDLDAKLKIEVRKEIQKVHRELDRPTIYVTHDQEEAMTMSDRIAVMNDGELEQIGKPPEIYEYPKNSFVAQFIGSPTMNFVDSQYETTDDSTGTVAAPDIGFESTFDWVDSSKAGLPESNAAVIGVRPQNVIIGDGAPDGGFTGTVLLLEQIDDRAQVTLDTVIGDFMATVQVEQDIEEGDELPIHIEEKFCVFDADTELLVGKGPSTNE